MQKTAVIFIWMFAFTAMTPASAQQVRAWLDTASIRIGEQATLHLEIEQPAAERYSWPPVADTIGPVEVLGHGVVHEQWTPDSLLVTRRQSLTVTCFDSGYFAIPPFVFRNELDTGASLETLPMLLAVHTVAVDTSKAIRDIKAPLEEPYTWQDVWPWALGGLAAAGAAWMALVWYRKRQERKNQVPARKVPDRPAHEIAIESLRALEDQKRWQQGDYKGYHTALTDIIRIYIEHRWHVNAMEMTTDEIMRYPVIYKLSSDNMTQLRYLLELADYVKFAKLVPVAHENEQSMKHAYDFVLDTRVSAAPAAAQKEEEVVS